MVKSLKGNQEQVVFELDADGEFGAAIKALQEAAWRLGMASYTLEEEHAHLAPLTYRPEVVRADRREDREVGACMAIAELLAAQVEGIASQTRKVRKRVRDI